MKLHAFFGLRTRAFRLRTCSNLNRFERHAVTVCLATGSDRQRPELTLAAARETDKGGKGLPRGGGGGEGSSSGVRFQKSSHRRFFDSARHEGRRQRFLKEQDTEVGWISRRFSGETRLSVTFVGPGKGVTCGKPGLSGGAAPPRSATPAASFPGARSPPPVPGEFRPVRPGGRNSKGPARFASPCAAIAP